MPMRTARLKTALFLLTGILSLLVLGVFLTSSFESIVKMALGSDRVLLSEDGQVIQTLRTDFDKRRLAWQPLSTFPESIQKAVIAAEDHRFYYHPGIDVLGLGRALWTNLRGQRIQGASTITMQVTDLIQPSVLKDNQKIKKGSLRHKLVQAFRALALEIRWSKKQILEAYLNLIHLRGELQGIPAASFAYLNKDPLALDQDEALVFAAMIVSPNQGVAALNLRACALKRKITSIDESCEKLSRTVELFFRGRARLPTVLGTAPHLARQLFQTHPNTAILKSTLSARLQSHVIAVLEKNIHRLKDANVRDTAAIVIDNSTGKVLAYVGAVSTSQSLHVDGVQAYRQAGSSLKPFLYAKAIEKKLMTASSVLLDDPTAISWGQDVYRPTNYDKHFFGPVTVREALGSSLNVPAIKTVMTIGLHQSYQVLQNLQLTKLKQPDFYGVSLALGAVEVRLDELANAYRIFANKGAWSPLLFTDKENPDEKKQIYSPESSFIVSSILSDPNARSIGFGWDSPLETPFWAAVKTGTSKDYRDNWCTGFSSRYTVAVWAGNFNSEAMKKVSGVSGAGPSWYEIMTYLHAAERSDKPPVPSGVVGKNIKHEWSSGEHLEYFITGTEPNGSIISVAKEKSVQFVFPAEGSVLVKDPHLDQSQIALYVKFKGSIPQDSKLSMNGKILGAAVSPFKLTMLNTGKNELSITSGEGKLLARVNFRVRGGQDRSDPF